MTFGRKTVDAISDIDRNRVADTLMIIENPMSIDSLMRSGRITRQHVEVLQQVAPETYKQFSQQLLAAAGASKKPLDLAQHVNLSILLGEPLVTSMRPEAISYYQAMYQGQGESEQGGAAPGGGMGDRVRPASTSRPTLSVRGSAE
jgi:hypothetical protein